MWIMEEQNVHGAGGRKRHFVVCQILKLTLFSLKNEGASIIYVWDYTAKIT